MKPTLRAFHHLALGLLLTASGHADPEAFRERFADPATRSLALESLIPGTRDHFFHTALDHQLAGRASEFQETIAAWKNAAAAAKSGLPIEGLAQLENRQLLIQYETSPEATLAELIRRLALDFDAARADDPDAVVESPTRLDPALIDEAAFEAVAASRNRDAPHTAFRGTRLIRELDKLDTFDDAKVRWFLGQLKRAGHPNTTALVLRGLSMETPVSFGAADVHQQLTAAQIGELLAQHPPLRSEPAAHIAYLAKSRPGSETDFARDLHAHAAHLAFCRDHALTLPPALPTLKAHILHHHLRLQSALGNFPLDDLLAYLALPRAQHPILLTPENRSAIHIDPAADFRAATGCPPIGDDTALIQDLLRHHLATLDEPPAALVPLIPAEALADIHARARLLAGAPPARWAAALDPSEFKSLQEKSYIHFAPGRPTILAANAEVALDLDLKNTPDLLIRIHELDVPAHVARHHRQPDVQTDLDGLVPHHERRITFDDKPPIIQHRQTIPLPELEGPGAWIIDFVSGSVSARALIRKGDLTTHLQRTPTGQTLHIFDCTHQPVANAALTLGSETLTSDAAGAIHIPNTPGRSITRGNVRTGKLATPIRLGTRDDDLALDIRAHLDREQLLANTETSVLIRPRLTNHGQSIALDRLENPSVTLKASLLGDLTIERVIAENLALAPTLEIPFQVPEGTLKLELTLRATITPATGIDPVRLTATTSWEPNQNLTSRRISNLFFSPTPDGHILEILGRNGEAVADHLVTLEFHRHDYQHHVRAQLHTDAKGRIQLGSLDGITTVIASIGRNEQTTYRPHVRDTHAASTIHQAAGDEIFVPLAEIHDAPSRHHHSLVEFVNDTPARDHFEKLAVIGDALVIRDLPPGSYRLMQDDTHTTRIEISQGTSHGDLLVSPTRILPHHVPPQPVITTAAIQGDDIVIRLNGHGPDTRVTLIGRRFAHSAWHSGDGLFPFADPLPDTLSRGFLGNAYITDRRLSDETRYILDRRAAVTFPGSLLPRPGTLLNRWPDDEIHHREQFGEGAQEGKASRDGGLPQAMRKRDDDPRRSRHSDDGHPAVCDFLAKPAVTRFQLTPEADGTLRIPAADFHHARLIEITAADSYASDTRILPLPAADTTPLRDRRLARPLDPATPHIATHSASVLAKDDTATIENLLDADWRAFATLADAHQLLYGMLPDPRLRDFVFITEWPNLPEARKLDLLRQNACHELHLFLARRDRPFFDAHVRPMLAEKPEPTFLDDLLLERDLTPYLRPFAWQKLNAAEKALLSQALPDARATITTDLIQRWEIQEPTPEADTELFTRTLRGTDLATEDTLGLARANLRESIDIADHATRIAHIREKLDTLIIPSIDFVDITVEEALDFLRLHTVELDKLEDDPSRKGVSFMIRRPRGAVAHDNTGAGLGGLPGMGDPGAMRIRELRLRNVPLLIALQYVCDQAGLRYRITHGGIVISPATDSRGAMASENVTTRTFQVPPDFRTIISQPSPTGDDLDPFAPPQGRSGLSQSTPIRELLQAAGVNFSEGTQAILTANGNLIVTNTPLELDKVEGLTMMAESSGGGRPQAFGYDLNREYHYAADLFAAPERASFITPRAPASTALDRTRRWRESNYHRHAGPTDESLIPLNRFWLALAAWDGEGAFLSPHFNACQNSLNEALMCLALLDLPFTAPRPDATVDGSALRVKAREPVILFYKDVRRAEAPAAEAPLLVRQSFVSSRQHYLLIDGLHVENTVTGDFRPGTPYIASLVVTNPTGTPRRIDLLAQIPAGAIPLDGHTATHSTRHAIDGHGVVRSDMAFYFPAEGEFDIHPFTVSSGGVVLARTEPRQLRVVAPDPDAPDDIGDSWADIAFFGTDADVLARLRTENLHAIELRHSRILRDRLTDREFFLQATAILRERFYHAPHISEWAFHHNDPTAIREYLENSDAILQLGAWLDSPLLEIRPRLHHDWQTLEFDPLVNPRAHRFADHPRLSHPEALAHYHAFLDVLAWKPALDAADHLTLAAFLFLQDRTAEALDRFAKIDPENLPTRLHYDYLHAVALFHQEQPGAAAEIAARRLPSLPPGLWRDRFHAVATQAAEIAALNNPGQATPNDDAEPPAAAPSLDIARGDAGKLVLRHQSLGQATLRLFSVDLEVLFSNDPFLGGDGATTNAAEPAILPNHILEVPLAADVSETTIQLPEPLRRGNLLVSATAGDARLLRILDSSALEIRPIPGTRTLRITETATGRPLPKTYVKIYIETHNGEVHFHKDGHTDLRGLIDHLSHPVRHASDIKRIAILAHHPDHGATTRFVSTPHL